MADEDYGAASAYPTDQQGAEALIGNAGPGYADRIASILNSNATSQPQATGAVPTTMAPTPSDGAATGAPMVPGAPAPPPPPNMPPTPGPALGAMPGAPPMGAAPPAGIQPMGPATAAFHPLPMPPMQAQSPLGPAYTDALQKYTKSAPTDINNVRRQVAFMMMYDPNGAAQNLKVFAPENSPHGVILDALSKGRQLDQTDAQINNAMMKTYVEMASQGNAQAQNIIKIGQTLDPNSQARFSTDVYNQVVRLSQNGVVSPLAASEIAGRVRADGLANGTYKVDPTGAINNTKSVAETNLANANAGKIPSEIAKNNAGAAKDRTDTINSQQPQKVAEADQIIGNKPVKTSIYRDFHGSFFAQPSIGAGAGQFVPLAQAGPMTNFTPFNPNPAAASPAFNPTGASSTTGPATPTNIVGGGGGGPAIAPPPGGAIGPVGAVGALPALPNIPAPPPSSVGPVPPLGAGPASPMGAAPAIPAPGAAISPPIGAPTQGNLAPHLAPQGSTIKDFAGNTVDTRTDAEKTKDADAQAAAFTSSQKADEAVRIATRLKTELAGSLHKPEAIITAAKTLDELFGLDSSKITSTAQAQADIANLAMTQTQKEGDVMGPMREAQAKLIKESLGSVHNSDQANENILNAFIQAKNMEKNLTSDWNYAKTSLGATDFQSFATNWMTHNTKTYNGVPMGSLPRAYNDDQAAQYPTGTLIVRPTAQNGTSVYRVK